MDRRGKGNFNEVLIWNTMQDMNTSLVEKFNNLKGYYNIFKCSF